MGDRMANLRAGCDALERDRIRVVGRSHVYETAAMEGAAGQQDFYNACIAVEVDLDPPALLEAVKRIEVELGRDPDAPRHAPRPLDIDLLLFAGTGVDEADLTVPHPGIEQRRFVLEPLLELDPPDRETLERALDAEAVRVQRVAQLPIIP